MSQNLNTNSGWEFPIPEAGEVDSVKRYKDIIEVIDDALLSKNHKAQLESHGLEQEGMEYDEYAQKYVTDLHYHMTPSSVPNADHATDADHATNADHATTASKLDPGAEINGHLFTGEHAITIQTNDIPDAHRVFWGTVTPENYSFPSVLRNGDLYVMYTA